MNKSSRLTKLNKRATLIVLLAVIASLCLGCAVACKANPSLTKITAEYKGGDVEAGRDLSKGDVVVTAYLSDNKSNVVTDFTMEYDFSAAGTKTVSVSYVYNGQTKTCSFTVNVVEKYVEPVTLQSITAVYSGGNVKVGGTLKSDGIVVTAHYSDETSKTVTNFSVSGFSSAQAGTSVVTVSYTENGVSKECSVNITIIDDSPIIVSNSNLSVHFLELGNQYTGDSVYIKAGDTDILIDAGSRESSANTIDDYISKYVTDGKLEYVIATHAHQDHIAGFVGSNSSKSILDRYQCDTLIRYAQAKSTSQIRKNFEAKCDEQAKKGVNVITALDCINNTNDVAKKVYNLTEDGTITMEVLEHKFYSQVSSDENDHSVCIMITQGDNHYLFTGDLEEKGEASLVDKNPNLPEMVLFKGGHHGSYTASNEVLLQKIKPQYVCICCCAGNVEYLTGTTQNLNHSFPAQEMIDRIAKYTDNVYVTTLGKIKWNGTKWANDGYESMNGNIVFSCVNGEISLNCSNNNLKLKDTDWFKNNRTCPKEWAEVSN